MKSKVKQEIFKDERTIQIEHKIGNELAFLAIILLLLSILVKLLYWRLDWQAYLPEIIIIFTLEIYAGVRSWQLGLDIRRSDKTGSSRRFRSRLANGAILAIVIVAVQMWSGNSALRPFFRHHPILQFIFILALITAFSSIFDQLVDYFYQKRQVLLDQELENDEN